MAPLVAQASTSDRSWREEVAGRAMARGWRCGGVARHRSPCRATAGPSPTTPLPLRAGSLADGVAIVDLDAGVGDSLPALDGGVGAVVVGTTEAPDPLAHPAVAGCDVVVGPEDPAVDAIAGAVAEHPIATRALAGLLRGSPSRAIDDGLTAESAVYSTLQAGPEFAAWLCDEARARPDGHGGADRARSGGRPAPHHPHPTGEAQRARLRHAATHWSMPSRSRSSTRRSRRWR